MLPTSTLHKSATNTPILIDDTIEYRLSSTMIIIDIQYIRQWAVRPQFPILINTTEYSGIPVPFIKTGWKTG